MVLIRSMGDRYRRARQQKRLTQLDVAAAIGCSQALVSNVEKGIVPATFRALDDLAGVLGLSVAQIEADIVAALPALRAAGRKLPREIEERITHEAA
jgi:transcriptional regulator with XRE-family HTH domain